jgi:very-short-patch-repair endonuclease
MGRVQAQQAGVADVAETVRFLGGVATWRLLRVVHPARLIRRATNVGAVVRAGHGRYVLPSASEHLTLAQSRAAALSHLSAAMHHGWAVKTVPDHAWVTVRRTRHLKPRELAGVIPRWADLPRHDVHHGITTPLRTVLDCARALPFDEALTVADSALRKGDITRTDLVDAAAVLHGAGSRQARRVATLADGRAANPFESVLRALAIAEGFELTPQLQIADSGLYAIVDLGSDELRLAVEADGFEHHGTRSGLRKDCRRHTEFAIYGWSSLRFSFEDVMVEPAWVRWALRTWRDVRSGGVLEIPPRRFR